MRKKAVPERRKSVAGKYLRILFQEVDNLAFEEGDVGDLLQPLFFFSGGAVASWLVCWTPERALRARALAGDIVLCS